MRALLQAEDLCKFYPIRKGVFGRKTGQVVKSVNHISFTVNEGDVFGIVGESGCGKSTTLKMILLLEEITGGRLLFEGRDITGFKDEALRYYHRSVQTMLQDPYASLSPRMRIRDIIAEPLEINTEYSREEIDRLVAKNLADVKLSPESAHLFPHEFSGGQRQRIALARAMALEPKLVLLDEPVSALDVSVRAQLMNLLMDIQRAYGLTYIIVAHDLAVIRYMCNRMMVMYLGKIVEYGDSEAIFRAKYHPYTKALFAAALPNDPDRREEDNIVAGEIPSPIDPPSGCFFHPRCPYARDICRREEPALERIGEDYCVACHFWREIPAEEAEPSDPCMR